jgi:uncharacterized phage protein gp47/JayE
MAFGVTAEGFVIKDLQTIRSELEVDFKSTFGDDLDVSDDSVAGQLIGNLSIKFSNIWELLQTVYNSFNPNSASSQSLDGASALVGVTRLAATPTDVVVALYGNLGTIIPINHLVSQSIAGEQFFLETAVTIALTSVIDIDYSVSSVLDNQLYTVTINGTGYTYTSDGTATANEIIAGLKTAIDLGGEPVTVTDNLDGTSNIRSTDGITAFSITVDANLQVDVQASPGNYESSNSGAISAPTNSIDTIVNPIAGLSSVDNIAAGATGREEETDEEFRIRRRELLTGFGSATDEAIRIALLQEVDEVTSAIVISNRTDITDSEGRPPHSFESVVTGGDEQEIADKIWENQPSGVQPYGSITKTVVDSTGRNQTVQFSRATNVYIWVQVDYNLNTEEIFPDNGEDTIKTNIAAFGPQEFTAGKDVIRQRLGEPIYAVSGIKDIAIRLATSASPAGPPGAYSEINITIDGNEISSWDVSRITVTQV